MAAAAREFARRNVDEAKLSNIVKDSGIARGSIYQYFEDREDLYTHVVVSRRADRAEFTRPAFALYLSGPFLAFFEQYYQLDSEYLFRHPEHIEIGKQMYAHAKGASLHLIQSQRMRYRELFLVALEADQRTGRVRHDVDLAVVADLCVHFMTDVFIFMNVTDRMSLDATRSHATGIVQLLRSGIEPPAE